MATPIPIAKPNSSGTGELIALATGPTFMDFDEDGNPLGGSTAGDDDEADTSGSNGDLNQEAEELDEFGQPLLAATAEQSDWDDAL